MKIKLKNIPNSERINDKSISKMQKVPSNNDDDLLNLNIIRKYNKNSNYLKENNIFTLIENMKNRQKKEKLNCNIRFNIASNINKDYYLKYRGLLIKYIKKLSIANNYKERTFYHALYFLDNYLSKIIDEKMDEKKLYLLSLSFFLLSVKFNENDIFEPSFGDFLQCNDQISFTVEEIGNAEIYCLYLLNYNLISYSIFDWLTVFFELGFLFEEECITKEIYVKIKNYIQKLLICLTKTKLLMEYNEMLLSLSLIAYAREKILEDNIRKDLFEVLLKKLDINVSDFSKCYSNLKIYIINKDNDNLVAPKSDTCNKNLSSSGNAKTHGISHSVKKKSNNSIPIRIEIDCEKANIIEFSRPEEKKNILSETNIYQSNIKPSLSLIKSEQINNFNEKEFIKTEQNIGNIIKNMPKHSDKYISKFKQNLISINPNNLDTNILNNRIRKKSDNFIKNSNKIYKLKEIEINQNYNNKEDDEENNYKQIMLTAKSKSKFFKLKLKSSNFLSYKNNLEK